MFNSHRYHFSVILIWVAMLTGCGERVPSPQPAGEATAPLTLTIVFGQSGDESARTVGGSVDYTADASVLDLLQAVAAENKIQVEHTGQGETAFVTGIDGVVGGQDGRGWWIYRVNGELSKQGSGTRIPNPGDQVVWEIGQYPAGDH